jgi:hypothetical protein
MEINSALVLVYDSATDTSVSNIPYNINPYTLQAAIANLFPADFGNVAVVFSGVYEYGGRWIISFN